MKAIARIKKLKRSNLAASEQHTSRQRDTPNANPAQPNQRLMNAGTVNETLADMIQPRLSQQHIRKDAVLCVEMLLSVSPEYFRSTEPAQAGYWEAEKLERFQWAVQQWLTENYHDRLLRAELHLDEATPHIHAYIIPIDERGRLNCKGLFGSREKLRQWQDSYAQALEPLGIERGIRGSRATHTAIQEYYAAVMEEPAIYLDAETMHHQVADRRLLLKERDELEQTVTVLAQENQVLRQQVNQLQAQVRASQQREVKLPTLDTVASRLGLRRDKHLTKHWYEGDMAVTITGDTAIALCMQAKQWDVPAAVLWLREQFGEDVAQRSMTEYVQGLFEAEPMQRFVAPLADERQWQQVKAYLTERYRLPRALVDRLHQQGLVYANASGKAVYALRDLVDGEVKGALLYDWGTGAYEVAAGSRSQSYFYLKGEGQQAVLVDSPIEAMSKWVLDQPGAQQRSYVSVTQLQDLPQDWLEQQREIVLAFGPEVAADLLLDGGKRVLPQEESWNQDLRRYFVQVQEQHIAQQWHVTDHRLKIEID